MLMIRLQRVGRRHDPSYRVVVTEKTNSPKTRKHVEVIGWYDAKNGKREIDGERARHWISNGAQLSGTVHNMLVDEKIIEGSKINVLPKRKPVEETAEEAKPAASEEAVAETDGGEAKPEEAPAPAEGEETKEAQPTDGEKASEESKEEAPAPDAEAPAEEEKKAE